MKYIRQYWDTTLLLLLTWCILNEDFSLRTLIIGLVVTLAVVIMIRLLFSNNDDVKNYRIQPYLFIWFLAVLFYQIISAAINTARAVFTHDVEPVVVELRITIHNHWFQCLVANSITLTPGTVTIDKSDHQLKVLWLYPTTDVKEEQEEIIFGAFQKILKRGDYRR